MGKFRKKVQTDINNNEYKTYSSQMITKDKDRSHRKQERKQKQQQKTI